MRPIFLAILAAALVGCAPKAEPPVAQGPGRPTGEAGLPGAWTGKPLEPTQPVEGGTEHYLYQTLGGYSLNLMPDGAFSADWRGLAMEGTWAKEPSAIVLTVVKVLGKDKKQAEAENKSKGKAVNDLSLFQATYSLLRTKDDVQLTLLAKKPDEESVVFSRDSG